MEPSGPKFWLSLAILLASIFGAYLSRSTWHRTIIVTGIFRKPANYSANPASEIFAINGTIHCEDLHYHEPSKLLFTACEESEDTRYSWFPPLANFDDPSVVLKSQGSIKTIDPITLQVHKLRFENFDQQFITHGIDVIDDPDQPKGRAVYVFAVNHRPDDSHSSERVLNSQKSRSVVEIFYHVIGSDSIRHIRSVWHPLLTTPNDVFGLSPTSLFVTNDHYYNHGPMRLVEDIYPHARWSNTIYVDFSDSENLPVGNSGEGIKASVALENVHNNNGIGHGRTLDEVLIASCTSGILHVATHSKPGIARNMPARISILESIELDSVIDNPSYFSDPYANETFDGSGFVVCGSSRAIDIPKNIRDPNAIDGIMVWKVAPKVQTPSDVDAREGSEWTKTLIFEDDGSRIRSASTALLVSLQPSEDSGHRQARLFITGYLSRSMIAVDIDI